MLIQLHVTNQILRGWVDIGVVVKNMEIWPRPTAQLIHIERKLNNKKTIWANSPILIYLSKQRKLSWPKKKKKALTLWPKRKESFDILTKKESFDLTKKRRKKLWQKKSKIRKKVEQWLWPVEGQLASTVLQHILCIRRNTKHTCNCHLNLLTTSSGEFYV